MGRKTLAPDIAAKMGRIGARRRAKKLTAEQRRAIAQRAARSRWSRTDAEAARIQHAEDAFRERVYWHTLAVVNLATLDLPQEYANSRGFRSAQEESIGTGTAVMWNGHELILTAAHVLEGASVTQIALMPRPASSLKELIPGSKLALHRRIEPRVRRIVRCEWEDLAFIELEAGEARDLKVRFADLTRSTTPRVGVTVVYLGHPSSSIYEVGRVVRPDGTQVVNNAIGPMITVGKISFLAPKEAKFYKGFDSKRHFVVDFPPADLGVGGRGFSGAGFWFYRESSGSIWEPAARLAGICTHQYSRKRLVKGVKMESVREFLTEAVL